MRALVFSGGGAKLHYLVGATQHLLGTADRSYDLFAGVSAGALVAAYLAQYPKGFEAEATLGLLRVTASMGSRRLYKRWFPFGALEALWKPSLYNSEPLRQLVRDEISVTAIQGSGRLLRVGCVGLRTGTYQLITESSPYLLDGVMASCAVPGFFTPVSFGAELHVDGGVRVLTPVGAAIAAGATEIDVVLTGAPKGTPQAYRGTPEALEVVTRSIGLMTDEIMERDLKTALLTNQLVAAGCSAKRGIVFRVVRPREDLGVSALAFDTVDVAALRALGCSDAARVV